MKIDHPLIYKLGGLLGSAAVRGLMGSLDCKVAFYDQAVAPIRQRDDEPVIYVFWHEYLLLPLHLSGHCNVAVLMSRHRDAEVLSHACRYLGFDFVRGSTNRGGVTAIRQLLRKSRNMHLAIASDGPRGPRRRLAPGPIYLASKIGVPIVAMGGGYDRPWRVKKAWDRFAVPRPNSRGRCITSPEIHIPPNLDRKGLEHFRLKVERLMNRLTGETESWAESKRRMAGEFIVQHRYCAPLSYTVHVPTKLPAPTELPVPTKLPAPHALRSETTADVMQDVPVVTHLPLRERKAS